MLNACSSAESNITSGVSQGCARPTTVPYINGLEEVRTKFVLYADDILVGV